MAEKEQQENQEQQEEKKKGGLLKWIILGGLVLLLAGGGFLAYTMFLAPGDEDQNATQSDTQVQELPLENRLVSLQPFVVNLADPLGRRFLKISMDVELVDQQAMTEFNRSLPKIKDSILLLLSSKTYADLAKMEDKLLLKKEIVDRIGQIIGKGKVANVYFTEFVIQ